MAFIDLLKNLPEVIPPAEKKLGFNEKLKWTLIILVAFFVLANIPLYGLSKNSLDRFEQLAIILGTDFGSIISLGIGPIVMASIILQLLVGAKILDIDTHTPEGKKFFQGLQKLLIFVFILFESSVYVLMKGLEAMPGLTSLVIFQLVLGGIAIFLMDEVTQKWGFGSGISLFIAAGVSWRLFTGLFQFIDTTGRIALSGRVLVLVNALIKGNTDLAASAFSVIAVTTIIFMIIVWMQSLKVELPLSYDRLRGYNIKWPLAFFYVSVIPVILVSALAANIQLLAGLMESWLGHATFLGGFNEYGTAISGFSFWIGQTNILELAIGGGLRSIFLFQSLFHILFYTIFSTIFSVFWVKTSGLDAQSQAKNIMASGLQIPGFRKDERVLESVLNRYIMPLTIMGGAAIGFIAAFSDLVGALVGGTAILLLVMIMYQFYNNIAEKHAMDMNPLARKFMGK